MKKLVWLLETVARMSVALMMTAMITGEARSQPPASLVYGHLEYVQERSGKTISGDRARGRMEDAQWVVVQVDKAMIGGQVGDSVIVRVIIDGNTNGTMGTSEGPVLDPRAWTAGSKVVVYDSRMYPGGVQCYPDKIILGPGPLLDMDESRWPWTYTDERLREWLHSEVMCPEAGSVFLIR
jgi:hypothetical protein